MDPRLKAYQKQTKPAPPRAGAETEPLAVPVVRAPKLPQFAVPPAPGKARTAASPALVKTTAPDAPAPATPGDKSLRKVAKFLILLGQDEAAKVVRHLDPSQIEAIGREIAGIKKIEPVEAEAILKEFGYLATSHAQTVKGGKGAAQAILDQAFGADKAKALFQKAVPHGGEKPFSFFSGLEKEVVLALLGPESAQVLSVVVPFLEKAQAAAFLKTLSPERRLDLVKRLATMEKVPSSVVAQVNQALQERFHAYRPSNTEAVDGRAKLADILRHMSVANEAALLKSLDSKPELADDLRRRLFTLADLTRVSDDGFEDLLRAKTDPQVALLWLSADGALRTKIEANISARRLLLVRAEIDLLSDTSPRELQKELRFFLDEVRDAVRQGRATLWDESEEYV